MDGSAEAHKKRGSVCRRAGEGWQLERGPRVAPIVPLTGGALVVWTHMSVARVPGAAWVTAADSPRSSPFGSRDRLTGGER